MKKCFILLAPLALVACDTSGLSVPPSPVSVANKTVLDEQAILAVELAYKAARTAAEFGVDAGIIKGDNATKVASFDNKAYAAVLAARTAYKAGNSSDYISAVASARSAVSQLLALTGK